MMGFKINVNGSDRVAEVDGDTPLLWVLRDVFGMTGTKFGCGMALCGACTVHVDGAATRSCITTIDSIGTSDRPGSTERGDRGEQLAPVAYRRHADVLQIIGCQLRQHCPIDFVFAEGDLVSLETLAAQPRRYVHRAPPFEEPQLPVDGR